MSRLIKHISENPDDTRPILSLYYPFTTTVGVPPGLSIYHIPKKTIVTLENYCTNTYSDVFLHLDNMLLTQRIEIGDKPKYRGGIAYHKYDPILANYLLQIVNSMSISNLFNQIEIRRYRATDSLPAHIDSIKFGDTIGMLSLFSDRSMTFRKGDTRHDVNCVRGTFLLLTDEARYQWTHELHTGEHDRWSIVLRYY